MGVRKGKEGNEGVEKSKLININRKKEAKKESAQT